MNYVDAAFTGWSEHDGATYADIALKTMAADRSDGGSGAGDAAAR